MANKKYDPVRAAAVAAYNKPEIKKEAGAQLPAQSGQDFERIKKKIKRSLIREERKEVYQQKKEGTYKSGFVYHICEDSNIGDLFFVKKNWNGSPVNYSIVYGLKHGSPVLFMGIADIDKQMGQEKDWIYILIGFNKILFRSAWLRKPKCKSDDRDVE